MVRKMVREMVNFRGSECGVRMSYFVGEPEWGGRSSAGAV
jgi:hypothetical protein